MKTLSKYNKAVELYKEAATIKDELLDKMEDLIKGSEMDLEISNTLTIKPIESTFKQYIYAVGLLTSQIAAAKLLGGGEVVELLESKLSLVISVKAKSKECREWTQYCYELENKSSDLYRLLSNEEKASLIELPVKPKK
jgi:hypothetical protein